MQFVDRIERIVGLAQSRHVAQLRLLLQRQRHVGARHEDHMYIGLARRRIERQIVALPTRKPDIRQQHIEGLVSDHLERLIRVLRFDNVETERAQQFRRAHANQFIVLDEQNAQMADRIERLVAAALDEPDSLRVFRLQRHRAVRPRILHAACAGSCARVSPSNKAC